MDQKLVINILQIWDFHSGKSRDHNEDKLLLPLEASYIATESGFMDKRYRNLLKKKTSATKITLEDNYERNCVPTNEDVSSTANPIMLTNHVCLLIRAIHTFFILSSYYYASFPHRHCSTLIKSQTPQGIMLKQG